MTRDATLQQRLVPPPRSLAWSIFCIAMLLAAVARSAEPPVTAACFAPGDQEILVGSQAGIQVLHWPSLKLKSTLRTELVHVHDLAFSASGKQLAAAGGSPAQQGGIEWFGWPPEPGGRPQSQLDLAGDVIYDFAWHGSKQTWLAAAGDHNLYAAASPTAKPQMLQGHSRSLLAVSWVDDELLVSGGIDRSIRLWEIGGRQRRSLDNHTGAVRALALRPSPDGLPLIASAGGDRTVRFWQPTIGRLVRFTRLASAPLDIAWTRDGKWLLAGCEDGHLRVIDPETVALVQDEPVLDGWAYSVAAGPRSVLIGGDRGALRVIPLTRERTDR